MTQRQPTIAVGILTVVLTVAGWSSVPLFLRHFAELIDPWTSNGWRYGFSALLWLPVLVVAAWRVGLPKGIWAAALLPSLVNAAGQVLFTYAHYRIDPALLTFGLRSQLIFVAIGAWMLFPVERMVIRSRGYLLGAGLLVLGMAAVILLQPPDDMVSEVAVHAMRDTGSAAARWQGVMLAVGSGLLFAAYGLSVRKLMVGINPVIAFAAICQFTALAMVILMLVLGDRAGTSALDLQPAQMTWLLISAVIGIAIGHVFYYVSLARLGVAVTAGVLQLQPFLVALGSLWFFDERLTGWQWVGGSVAVCGAWLMLRQQRRVAQAAPPIARRVEEPVAIAEGESGS